MQAMLSGVAQLIRSVAVRVRPGSVLFSGWANALLSVFSHANQNAVFIGRSHSWALCALVFMPTHKSSSTAVKLRGE